MVGIELCGLELQVSLDSSVCWKYSMEEQPMNVNFLVQWCDRKVSNHPFQVTLIATERLLRPAGGVFIRQKQCAEPEIGDVSKMEWTKSGRKHPASKTTQCLDLGSKLDNYQDLGKLKEVFFFSSQVTAGTPGSSTNQRGSEEKVFLCW